MLAPPGANLLTHYEFNVFEGYEVDGFQSTNVHRVQAFEYEPYEKRGGLARRLPLSLNRRHGNAPLCSRVPCADFGCCGR